MPLNSHDVASLKLRDLQWFLDLKGISVSSSDRREKPVLVERIMNYSRQGAAQSSYPQSYQPLYPSLSGEPNEHMRGLFGNQSVCIVKALFNEYLCYYNDFYFKIFKFQY